MTQAYLLQSIFKQSGIAHISLADTEDVIRLYPYFAIGHLIRVQKLKLEGEELSAAELKKAKLFVPHNFLLHQLLVSLPQKVSPNPDPITATVPPLTGESAVAADADSTPSSETTIQANPLPFVSIQHKPVPEISVEQAANALLPQEEGVTSPSPGATGAPGPLPDAPEQENQSKGPGPGGDAATTALPAAEPVLDYLQPLITEDYFAYKRIKEPQTTDQLTEEGKAEMRSFTDWLRSLKKNFAQSAQPGNKNRLNDIYVSEEEAVMSERVEKMALESISAHEEVVTEAMAEVRIKQGQYNKARDIYEKLSLLNPEKSPYFAQKIEELKNRE